jgi:hypothetical protein
LLGIGAVLFIFSFFEYYTVSAGGFSDSAGGWHFSDGTFIAWFAFILGFAASVIVALGIFLPAFKLPVANYVAAMGLFALSAVLYLIGFFIIGPDDSQCLGNSACENAIDDAFGFGFSYWLSFILVIAGAVIALMRAQQTGAALPGALGSLPNLGQRGPQGGVHGGQQYPAAGYGAPPGYGAPQQPAPGYGAPQQPAPGYGAPQQPAPGYGAPQQPAPGYGPPPQGPPPQAPPPPPPAAPPQPQQQPWTPPQQGSQPPAPPSGPVQGTDSTTVLPNFNPNEPPPGYGPPR